MKLDHKATALETYGQYFNFPFALHARSFNEFRINSAHSDDFSKKNRIKEGLEVDLLKKLAAEGLAIVVSSHDVTFISQILDQAYLLDNGKVTECYDSNIHSLKQDCPNIGDFLRRS